MQNWGKEFSKRTAGDIRLKHTTVPYEPERKIQIQTEPYCTNSTNKLRSNLLHSQKSHLTQLNGIQYTKENGYFVVSNLRISQQIKYLTHSTA